MTGYRSIFAPGLFAGRFRNQGLTQRRRHIRQNRRLSSAECGIKANRQRGVNAGHVVVCRIVHGRIGPNGL